MFLLENEQCDEEPLSSIIKKFVLSAFSVLSALTFRDLVVVTLERALPKTVTQKLIFVYIHSLCIVFITVVIAYYWRGDV
jgi:hypothetical protein